MTSDNLNIRLSETEWVYLCRAAFLDPTQVETLRRATPLRGAFVLRLPTDEAEQFRSAFTEQLARVGFDEKYEVNSEGRMLEDLIDRFFIA